MEFICNLLFGCGYAALCEMNKKRSIKLISFLLFLIPLGTVGCFNLNPLTTKNIPAHAGSGVSIYTKDKTFIKLEEMRRKKGTPKTFFNHPKYLRSDILSTKLSSIYFKEKGVRGWGKGKNVFLESELLSLMPHITGAVSKAAPSQYVLVNSVYIKGKGFFKSELYTIFALFISNEKLNIVFSRIHYEPVIEKGESSIFTNPEDVFTDPFSIKKNPFWKLMPSPEQHIKKGYDNWLIIDLEKSTFVKEEQEKDGMPEAQNVQGQQGGTGASTTGGTGVNYPVMVEAKVSIKDQLLELKKLEEMGLISREDYDRRKTQILLGKDEKTIRDRFIELRSLREKGFIDDTDYEQKKREILDEEEEVEKKRNIKEVLEEYLELRDEGFITDTDYNYKKKQLLNEF